jgi:hypothetical protein
VTPDRIQVAVPALVKLNQWARLSSEEKGEMYYAGAAIYAMKRTIIKRAIELGMCTSRLIAVERPCKTCKGTGMYTRVDYDGEEYSYDDCRRCDSKGRVTLRFLETTICGARWHTPRPKLDFIKFTEDEWSKAETTDWTPEQPGAALGQIDLLRSLNDVERAIFGDKLIRCDGTVWPRANPYLYPLFLGEFRDCFVCGRDTTEPGCKYWYSHRIGSGWLRWKAQVCDWRSRNCDERARKWPLRWPYDFERRWLREDNFTPLWYHRAPLPDSAYSPLVEEWLARRGIRIGLPAPGQYVVTANTQDYIEVAAVKDGHLYARASCTSPLFDGYGQDARLIRVKPEDIRPWAYKLIGRSE